MDPLGHGAIRSLHLADLGEQIRFSVRLCPAAALLRLHLFGALLHRGSLFIRESLLAGRGGLLRRVLRTHRSLLCELSHVLAPTGPEPVLLPSSGTPSRAA